MGWYERLLRQRLSWEEKLLIRQRSILLDWVAKNGAVPGETVTIFLSGQAHHFSFSLEGWKKSSPSSSSCFVLCEKGVFSEAKAVCRFLGEWRGIFLSSTFEVWENVTRYEEEKRMLPLRLGLSEEERHWMTTEVRRMMGDVLEGREPQLSPDPFGRLAQKQDLDIAVWVEGRLRASVIMIGLSCQEALEVGARRATWDRRFAPLTKEELPEARIEITFMSDLIFPVLQSELEKNRIDPTKGYMAHLPALGKKGWYLPEVHNVISFTGLRNFLQRLATEKAGVAKERVEECFFGQFATFDWIESSAGILGLSGPTEAVPPPPFSETDLRIFLDQSVLWLGGRQEASGNIPAILSQSGVVAKRRLPALGCTGHALAVYGEAFGHDQALQTAEKIYAFLISARKEAEHPKPGDEEYYFALVYFLRLSLALGKEVDGVLVAELTGQLPAFGKNTMPLLWLQTLSLLADLEQQGVISHRDLLRQEAKKAWEAFKKNRTKEGRQLAFYPELIAVCAALEQLDQSEKERQEWKEKAIAASQWYRGLQRENGSFPHFVGDTFAYTRGTGKIFEVLACFPEENKKALGQSFAWLSTMCYQAENTFFFSEKEKALLCGGFRHDAFNREVWIDASAHVILGLTRMLRK